MAVFSLRALLKGLKYSASVCALLLRDQGYFRSVAAGEYRDETNNYIPWFTYSAIEGFCASRD